MVRLVQPVVEQAELLMLQEMQLEARDQTDQLPQEVMLNLAEVREKELTRVVEHQEPEVQFMAEAAEAEAEVSIFLIYR